MYSMSGKHGVQEAVEARLVASARAEQFGMPPVRALLSPIPVSSIFGPGSASPAFGSSQSARSQSSAGGATSSTDGCYSRDPDSGVEGTPLFVKRTRPGLGTCDFSVHGQALEPQSRGGWAAPGHAAPPRSRGSSAGLGLGVQKVPMESSTDSSSRRSGMQFAPSRSPTPSCSDGAPPHGAHMLGRPPANHARSHPADRAPPEQLGHVAAAALSALAGQGSHANSTARAPVVVVQDRPRALRPSGRRQPPKEHEVGACPARPASCSSPHGPRATPPDRSPTRRAEAAAQEAGGTPRPPAGWRSAWAAAAPQDCASSRPVSSTGATAAAHSGRSAPERLRAAVRAMLPPPAAIRMTSCSRSPPPERALAWRPHLAAAGSLMSTPVTPLPLSRDARRREAARCTRPKRGTWVLPFEYSNNDPRVRHMTDDLELVFPEFLQDLRDGHMALVMRKMYWDKPT